MSRPVDKKFIAIFFFSISILALLLAYIIHPLPRVTEVVDGDTIKLSNGKTVRYIGVDTPEKGDCFYEQAKKINQDLVLDRQVEIKTDQNNMDRFGRTLAYVWLDDMLVN